MNETDLVWFLIAGVLGMLGTVPVGEPVGRNWFVFLAFATIALFSFLGLVGALAVI